MTRHLEDARFSKLTVIKQTSQRSQKSIIWECRCDCGEIVYVASRDLTTGNVKGHRHCKLTPSNRPLYSIWHGIKQRCYNPNSPSYKDYGGRGITMSKEWLDSYMQFELDMGIRPSDKHSIDRINVDGNYSVLLS